MPTPSSPTPTPNAWPTRRWAWCERQYQLGAVSYLASLDAQRTCLSTRVALVQARAARFTDTAALFQALGGGWWNAPDAVASAASAPAAAH